MKWCGGISATMITAVKHSPGNGAREAMQRYFAEWPSQELELGRVDHMLAWLWVEGFKVVPCND
jgi:hypothetical protein